MSKTEKKLEKGNGSDASTCSAGFDEWWSITIQGSDEWTTLERLAAFSAWVAATERATCNMTRVRIGVSRMARSGHEQTREYAKSLLTLFGADNNHSATESEL